MQISLEQPVCINGLMKEAHIVEEYAEVLQTLVPLPNRLTTT